ncbi:hypothetical protein Sste5346_009983 [Sporothrix stenoceras]|uniref:EGF domain-specific O-linked N-acetylglucosamine transferase n=1 Tax=Sporothrix stenoceras TaxID=5173 RepID=A0ABR3YHZ0_9PEZI
MVSLLVSMRRRLLSVLLAFLVTLAVYTFFFSDTTSALCSSCLPDWSLRVSESPSKLTPPTELLTIPELDNLTTQPPGRDVGYCRQHFSGDYLSDLRDHSIQYCEDDGNGPASSTLTCFHGYIRGDSHADSFCIGSGATWDETQKKFSLDCPVQRIPNVNETARGLIPFTDLQPYWFNTGPKRIFEGYVSIKGQSRDETKKASSPSFVLLIRREGAGNLWHCLMEIWSMTMTFDVLRMARQEETGEPFYTTPMDMDNTHVVILDDHGPGPTMDLWRFFSKHPIVTLQDMTKDPSKLPAPLRDNSSSTNIVVPLPGGSNPLWHNDWIVRDCHPDDAPLLHLFVQRVFAHFDLPQLAGPKTNKDGMEPIVVTFIDRRGTRRLLNNVPLLEALRQKFPSDNIVIQSIDMATLSLPDQLRLVQDTDVLVGVHGAGLTHTMFMRHGAGAIVEIQPEGLAYKGFRNLAAMTGHRYFSAEAEMVAQGEETEEEKLESQKETQPAAQRKRNDPPKPWQASNVRMEEDRFLELMDVAIKCVYNEGLRNQHVVR